jgi:Flp pilus assembly protein TadG
VGVARAREGGTAIVGTLVGFLVFMIMLLFSVQILVRLYATSVLSSAATRAAETVAQSGDPRLAVAGAQAEATSQLGTFGATRTRFVWKEVDAQQVVLEVEGSTPGLLPLPASWRNIDRTVVVRTERFR